MIPSWLARAIVSKKELLLHEIVDLPEPILADVLNFVLFLKTRAAVKGCDTALASQSSLQKDWLRPEEDEAWRNL